MPKVNIIQTNFTAGELSPRMKGRRDVARYQNGAEIIENGIVLVHGGVERRPGLRYCATAKDGADTTLATIVVPYVFNRDQAYVLEFGDEVVRIFDVDGGLLVDDSDAVIEVASPYTADQLDEITWHQGGDTLFLHHPDIETYRFQRRSATVWTLQPVPWVVVPFAEVGHVPDNRVTIDNPAVGTGRTFTTSAVVVPGAPTNVVATPLNGGARITFDAPADTGGSAVTSYTATSSPGGITATGAGTTLTMDGLTNGVAYTFTVTASNSAGTGAASAASAAVTPLATLASPSITATATPTSKYHQVGNGTIIGLSGPTASSSDGVAPMTYAWSKVSGSSGIVLNSSDTAQPLYRSTGTGTTNTAILECEVTDSLGASGTVQVNISVEHGAAWRDSPGTIEP